MEYVAFLGIVNPRPRPKKSTFRPHTLRYRMPSAVLPPSAAPTGAAPAEMLNRYADMLTPKNFLAFVASFNNFSVGLRFSEDQFNAVRESLTPVQRTLLESCLPKLKDGHVLLVFVTPFLFASGFTPKQVDDKIAMIKAVCAMIDKESSITLLGLLLNGKAGDHVRVGLDEVTMPLCQNAEPHITLRVEPGFDVVKYLGLELAKYDLAPNPGAKLPGEYTPLGLPCNVTVAIDLPSKEDTRSMTDLREFGKGLLDTGREITLRDIAFMGLLAAKADHEVKSDNLAAALAAQTGASGPAKKAADKAVADATKTVEKAKDLVAAKQAALDASGDASASPAPTGAAVGGAGGPSAEASSAPSSSSSSVATPKKGKAPPQEAPLAPIKAPRPPSAEGAPCEGRLGSFKFSGALYGLTVEQEEEIHAAHPQVVGTGWTLPAFKAKLGRISLSEDQIAAVLRDHTPAPTGAAVGGAGGPSAASEDPVAVLTAVVAAFGLLGPLIDGPPKADCKAVCKADCKADCECPAPSLVAE